MARYNRRQFIRSAGVAGTVGLSALSGCTGILGGGDPSVLNFHYVVPIENAGSLLSIDEIQEQLEHRGEAYELEVVHDSSTPDSINAMATGDADLALATTVSYSSTVNKDAVPGGISIIGTDFWDAHPERYAVTVFSGPDSEITEPADLEGRKLGVNALGTGIHSIYVKALVDAGLDPENDVQFVETGFPTFTASIKDGTIDVGVYPALFAVNARNEGFTEVYNTNDLWQEAYPFAYVVARKDSLENKSEAIDAWADDYAGLMDHIRNNREQVATQAAEQFELPEEAITSYYFTDQDYHRDVNTDMDRLQFVVDEMQSLGFIDETFDVNDHATNEYLP